MVGATPSDNTMLLPLIVAECCAQNMLKCWQHNYSILHSYTCSIFECFILHICLCFLSLPHWLTCIKSCTVHAIYKWHEGKMTVETDYSYVPSCQHTCLSTHPWLCNKKNTDHAYFHQYNCVQLDKGIHGIDQVDDVHLSPVVCPYRPVWNTFLWTFPLKLS